MSDARFWRGNRGNRFRNGNFRSRGGRGRMNGQFGPNRNNYYEYNNFGRTFQQPKVKRDAPSKRLSEEEIGVTEYINEHEGFNGIIKSRYSDFQVSEINLKGEVAKLTNQEPPSLPKEKDIDEDEDLVLNKYNLEILPMETWDNINKLAIATNPCTDKVEIDVTGMDKEHRTKIHDAVKKAFGKGVIGSTVTVDDKKFVCFEKYRKGVRIDRRVKWAWPGEYTHFILHKENCDTMEAASRLAEKLRLNLRPSMVGYAGTKDRRAKTSQWFSLRKVDPARVAAAGRELRDVHVGDYSFSDTHLRLGMLQGNRFRITLRNVTATDECVDEACALLKRDGFINYYGLQRFGTRVDTPTYQIGLKLFQGNLEEAINLILEQREGPLQHVLQLFHSAGAAAAWRACSHAGAFPNELRLIKALAACPRDLAGAISKIPRNSRLLYIHAYQSLVWNKVASRRLQQLGLRPAVGDIVPLAPIQISEDLVDDEESEDEEDPEAERVAEKPEPEPADEVEPVVKKTKKSCTKEEWKEVRVKVLSQEDIDSGQYTLFDVVLPLPGAAVTYPPNMLPYYEELLAKDGLSLDMKNKVKSYSMTGAYRHLVVRPSGMEWRRVRYSDPYCDLVLSDLDELRARTDTGALPDGKFKALILSFNLPTSCYATMMLRELLKVDTSCDNQALQNNYHKVKARKQSDAEKQSDAQEQSNVQSDAQEQSNVQSDAPLTMDDEAFDELEKGNSSEGGAEKRKHDEELETDAKKVKQVV